MPSLAPAGNIASNPGTRVARLNGLTVLRFGAALWVLLFHLQLRMPIGPTPFLSLFYSHGAYAMSFFFILSGVVLTYGYNELTTTGHEVRHFYLARLARLYPAYAVVHLVGLLWLSIPLPEQWTKWIFINVLSALGLQAWFQHAFFYGVNSGSWSVSVEFFLYALFPVLLPSMKWLRVTVGTPRLCLYITLLSGFIGLADYVFDGQETGIYYMLPFLRLPEFLLGITVGLALLKPRANAPRLWLNVFLLAAVASLAAATLDIPGLWTRANIVVVPAFAFLIYATARLEQQKRSDWRSGYARVLVYLGESSYCFFLIQFILLLWLDSKPAWRREFLEHYPTLLLWLMTLIATSAGAVVLHELVEKPARRAILRRMKGKPTRLGILTG